ncbi:hypothetical protein [Pararhizobium mangrovi]|uniref:Uncharacterized protein n=1 Tax=Pararhizobium mangrovi TaxID=2590452 RepID=A0A506U1F3_9HYPH|nr:hypothetical protein [Pararhizobium mangrovi]TPW28182.1 hypothetical protein FJU11_09995 [Pararhizobium mangrovi]
MKRSVVLSILLCATFVPFATRIAAGMAADRHFAQSFGTGNGNGNGNVGNGNGNGNAGNGNGNGNTGDDNGNGNAGSDNGNDDTGSGFGNGFSTDGNENGLPFRKDRLGAPLKDPLRATDDDRLPRMQAGTDRSTESTADAFAMSARTGKIRVHERVAMSGAFQGRTEGPCSLV